MTEPDQRWSCGHQGPPGARYCPQCGLPVVSDDAAVTTQSAARRSPDIDLGRRASWMLTAVLALVVGLIGWWFVDAADDTIPGPVPEGGDATGEPMQQTGSAATPSIESPPDEADIVGLSADDIARRPELALLSGHHLFVADSVGLHRIDTDTGAVDEYRRSVLPGALVGRYRDQLILIEEQRRVLAVPAADPSREPVLVLDLAGSDTSSSVQQARMIDDHRLVLTVWSFAETFADSLGRLIVDLDSRTVTSHTADDTRADDLTWVVGGGLFEVTGDDHRWLAGGYPEVAGRRFVLVYECDGHNDCDRRWIDRRSGGVADRPVPPEGYWQMQFVDADDRVLFVNGEDGHRYFDALHGWLLPANLIRGTSGDYFDHPAEAVVGGRILLAPTVDGIVAYDLDSHDAHLIDLGEVEVRGVTAIVAIPKVNRRQETS